MNVRIRWDSTYKVPSAQYIINVLFPQHVSTSASCLPIHHSLLAFWPLWGAVGLGWGEGGKRQQIQAKEGISLWGLGLKEERDKKELAVMEMSVTMH